MFAMRDAPRMIGHQQQRMANRSNGIINYAIITECLVTTLVGNNPHAGHDASLSIPVEAPERIMEKWSHRCRGNKARQIKQDCNLDEIHNEVSEAEEKRAFEAVLRNGILDRFESKLGRRKGQISWA